MTAADSSSSGISALMRVDSDASQLTGTSSRVAMSGNQWTRAGDGFGGHGIAA